jgi:hypothetical protein
MKDKTIQNTNLSVDKNQIMIIINPKIIPLG